jgi:putative ABC transport system permease protein
MNILQLTLKEITRRKLNFLLGMMSVVLAVTILVGSLTMLKGHDIRTSQIIAQKEEETKQRMVVLEDDYRKIMKNLGFNLLLLPKDQNLGDLYADDFASKYMSEETVSKLSASKILTIRHLLPSLQQKIKWPEQQRTIILIGTRGEVPFLHRDPKEPILIAVPKGSAIVGHELAVTLNLQAGDAIKLLGKSFNIKKCNEERGSKDDITIWIDLQEAQQLFKKPDLINAILALKCFCAGNEISQIRKEISVILPDVQIIEQGTKVITRAEARDRAVLEAQQALQAEVLNRQRMRNEQERFSSILVPLVLLASGIWIGLLFVNNVRERKSEIGILRAIGVRANKILFLFLSKALVMGTVGAVIGYFAGLFSGLIKQGFSSPKMLLDAQLFVLALLLALLLSILASWVPAFLASRQDPAEVLREE